MVTYLELASNIQWCMVQLFHQFYLMGIKTGIFPLLIFMGVGALTDFGPLLANPKTLFLGAAAQFGIAAALGGKGGRSGAPSGGGAICGFGGAGTPDFSSPGFAGGVFDVGRLASSRPTGRSLRSRNCSSKTP